MFYIAAPFGNYLKIKNTRSVIGSFTLKKRKGLLKQIAKTLRYKDGNWYNSLGLRNPGIHFGLKYYYRSKSDIISLAAIEPRLIELNKIVSQCRFRNKHYCPNIKHFEDYTRY